MSAQYGRDVTSWRPENYIERRTKLKELNSELKNQLNAKLDKIAKDFKESKLWEKLNISEIDLLRLYDDLKDKKIRNLCQQIQILKKLAHLEFINEE